MSQLHNDWVVLNAPQVHQASSVSSLPVAPPSWHRDTRSCTAAPFSSLKAGLETWSVLKITFKKTSLTWRERRSVSHTVCAGLESYSPLADTQTHTQVITCQHFLVVTPSRVPAPRPFSYTVIVKRPLILVKKSFSGLLTFFLIVVITNHKV